MNFSPVGVLLDYPEGVESEVYFMWQYQGFKTHGDAVKFRSNHGGFLVFEERTLKRKILTNRGKEYLMCVDAGLNKELYPYAVVWRI